MPKKRPICLSEESFTEVVEVPAQKTEPIKMATPLVHRTLGGKYELADPAVIGETILPNGRTVNEERMRFGMSPLLPFPHDQYPMSALIQETTQGGVFTVRDDGLIGIPEGTSATYTHVACFLIAENNTMSEMRDTRMNIHQSQLAHDEFHRIGGVYYFSPSLAGQRVAIRWR